MNAAVRIENLTVAYRRHPALHHISGCFEEGSLSAIVGPNGAGKSTLLGAIMQTVPVATGRAEVAPALRASLAYLPQRMDIDRSFPLSVLEVVLLGAWREAGIFGRFSRAMHARASQALAEVGLAGFEARLIGELSAGQFQRVMFARLLLQDARLILLDEPFNAVDERTTDDLLRLVRAWHAQGRTVIAVLHDMAQVQAHFPQAVLLARELLAWGPTAGVLAADHLARARRLALGWDEAAPDCTRPEAA
ncbi:MAG: ABC transporter ATP-binding protein [Candidatus Dactylopiibacterium sp.]|nr:ABC transporter ATP-binding protein [Candidatus Dactylopiibacterium sp.]